jgi:alpha-glucosidase
MPWVAGKPNLGFTYGEPWLPVAPEHKALAAATQEHDQASTLWFTRRLVSLRRSEPALRVGAMTLREASDQVLAFERSLDGVTVCCAFNLSTKPAACDAWKGQALAPLLEVGDCQQGPGGMTLGPRSALILRKA